MNTKGLLKSVLIFPFASAVCFVGSYLVARILLMLNNGFGAGDLSAFIPWTVLFAVCLVVPAILFAILLRNVRTINRVWLGILLGGLAGFGWTLMNLWFLGPWFGAWSFNVLYCWIGGGVLGLLAVALTGQRQERPLS